MLRFSNFIFEQEESTTHHASVIPLTGFSPISHMGHAKDLGSTMKSLPGQHHVGISSKSDVYSDEERSNLLRKQWEQPNLRTHIVKSAGETIANAFHALPKTGKKVLHLLVGADRKNFAHGLKKSLEDGKIKEMGDHRWDEIHVHHPEDENREHGMSGTKMRDAASRGDIGVFHQHLGSAFSAAEAKRHMKKVADALKSGQIKVKRPGNKTTKATNESARVIFVSGGPGSGKDIIIRECINDPNIIECNLQQVMNILNDKHKLAIKSMNPRMEAVRTRGSLIINGPADDFEKISNIKEELEELDYETMMIFVDTTNEISQKRNSLLTKMISESVRETKWQKSQHNALLFDELFSNFIHFDNSNKLDTLSEELQEIISKTTEFLNVDGRSNNYSKHSNPFVRLYESNKGSNLKPKKLSVLKDNNSPVMQFAAKLDRRDDVRDGDIKSNCDYMPKAGGGNTYTEDRGPVMIKPPGPKVANFNRDADSNRKKRLGDRSLTAARIGSVDGISSPFDSRGNGSGASGAGLGDTTYRESTEFSNDDIANYSGQPRGVNPNPLSEKNKKLKKFKESIFDFGQGDSGVGGTLGGAGNKEDFVTPQQKYGQSGITIKKKKTGAK